MTDPSNLPAEAAAINKVTSPHVHTFAVDAAANIVAHDQRITALEIEVAKLTQPPPPPPPPVAASTIAHVPSAWDTWPKGAVRTDWNVAAVVAQAKAQTLFSSSVAAADATPSTPVVPVMVTVETPRTLQVAIPAGTRRGSSLDHSLTVYDATRGLQTDLWEANGPPVTSADGAAQFAAGSVTYGADAALLPLRCGLILPSDLYPANLGGPGPTHPLVFAISDAGTGPGVYPSTTQYGGKTAGLPPFGARLGFPAGTTWPAMDKLSDYVCRCLADPMGGMFLRDLGTGGTLTIYGLDAINQGGAATWAAAGVTLQENATLSPPLYYAVLSPLIPWDKLEAYNPPTP